LVEIGGELRAGLGVFEAVVFGNKGSVDIHADTCQGWESGVNCERRGIACDYAVADLILTAELVGANNIGIEPVTGRRWGYNCAITADCASAHTVVIH
jgi:hypothetical protein